MKETLEYRSGVEWQIAYAENTKDEPVAARIVDAEGRERASILPDEQAGEYNLVIEGDSYGWYDNFDEALGIASGFICAMPPWDQEGYVIHELTGNPGIYRLGSIGDTEYVANAFWSAEKLGYVNHGVFAIHDDEMKVLTSSFCNDCLTIEECVRDLASDFTPLENPDITFEAWCNREIKTLDEYRAALDEGRLGEPIPVPSWGQIGDAEAGSLATEQDGKKAFSHDQPLEDVAKEAASRAAEKNALHTARDDERKPPDMAR